MFLKDKEENILLPETITLPRQDSNPLVIHLEGNASDLSTRYKVKSSRGNEYEIVSFGGPSFRIYGNVDQITHVKCYNFGNWAETTALIHDIKAHGVKNNKNVYGRPFYKTVKNSYSIGAEEIYNSGSNAYVEAIACDDGEPIVRAFSDYYIFPYTINSKSEDWVAYLGNANYRSTYTSIPFAIEAMPDSKNYIDMLYFGNGGNNPGQPEYWNVTLEIYEKNLGTKPTVYHTVTFSPGKGNDSFSTLVEHNKTVALPSTPIDKETDTLLKQGDTITTNGTQVVVDEITSDSITFYYAGTYTSTGCRLAAGAGTQQQLQDFIRGDEVSNSNFVRCHTMLSGCSSCKTHNLFVSTNLTSNTRIPLWAVYVAMSGHGIAAANNKIFHTLMKFNKWQLNGSDFNFSTPITSDITLTGDWI